MKTLQLLCQIVLVQLSKEGYTDWGIIRHRRTYNALCNYAQSKGCNAYSDELAQTFLSEKYQVDMSTKRGNNTYFANMRITHLMKLSHFNKFGNIHYCSKKGQKLKQKCPSCYEPVWLLYLVALSSRDYSDSTIARHKFQSMKFLQFLTENKITDLNDISYKIVSKYFLSHMKQSKNYLKSITYCLRLFFCFLIDNGIANYDYQQIVPTIHMNREAFLPSTLEQYEITDIINSVDTTTKIGKRDMALLLIASQMGIRTSDIKRIRLKNFNWKDHKLNIIQEKTGQLLCVPIPLETGWSIINYIKYGRPDSDDDHLFIRHSPEGGPFSSRNKLQDTLHKYIRKANIEYPQKEHRGLHSLRSGYAKILLKNGTPLPVISELLGHSSSLSTSHYLRIDVINLRQCAIDVEEVLQND